MARELRAAASIALSAKPGQMNFFRMSGAQARLRLCNDLQSRKRQH